MLIELEMRRQVGAFILRGNSLSTLWLILSGPGHGFLDTLNISSNSFVLITIQSSSVSKFVLRNALVSFSIFSQCSAIFVGTVVWSFIVSFRGCLKSLLFS